MADPRIGRYIVAVIMAPLPDTLQTDKYASDTLGALQAGRCEAYWLLTENNRRCGVIAFTTGPYSDRVGEKDISVLYVVGVAMPTNATPAAWRSLMESGREVAKEKGCRYIIFDVAPNGPLTSGIIEAAITARAQARFTIEV
jgi:hypothetical protein